MAVSLETIPQPAIEPQTAAPIVAARGIEKTYDTGKVEVHALRGVDLVLRRGEMAAVMGPSGCGKTTLLNCLSGLDAIDGGEVRIEGTPLSEMSDRERTDYRARRMGFVFQFYNLMPVLTAVENVELPLLVARVNPKEARRRALEALDMVGLVDWAGHVPDELSGGQRQRVWLAMVLAQRTGILLLDEPTTFLDLRYQVEILDLVRDLATEGGVAVGVVLHDLNQAAEIADTVVLLHQGTVRAEGPPEAVLTEDNLSEAYGLRIEVSPDPATGRPTTRPVGRHTGRPRLGAAVS
jgi:putative ABC transport system ATP-binding protein